MKKITLLLVDDHAVMRMGLVSLLGSCDEFQVIADTGDGNSGIRKALATRPDVVILDLAMPDKDGLETTHDLLEKWPEAKILILTTFGSSDSLSSALETGALGAILKSADLKELRKAIISVANGKHYVSDEITQIIETDPPVPTLTQRQKDILDSVTRGLENEDIARCFNISVPMVKEHLTTIFRKIGAANRAEAVAIALRKHLLKI